MDVGSIYHEPPLSICHATAEKIPHSPLSALVRKWKSLAVGSFFTEPRNTSRDIARPFVVCISLTVSLTPLSATPLFSVENQRDLPDSHKSSPLSRFSFNRLAAALLRPTSTRPSPFQQRLLLLRTINAVLQQHQLLPTDPISTAPPPNSSFNRPPLAATQKRQIFLLHRCSGDGQQEIEEERKPLQPPHTAWISGRRVNPRAVSDGGAWRRRAATVHTAADGLPCKFWSSRDHSLETIFFMWAFEFLETSNLWCSIEEQDRFRLLRCCYNLDLKTALLDFYVHMKVVGLCLTKRVKAMRVVGLRVKALQKDESDNWLVGGGGVIEKELEFKPSFGEYLCWGNPDQ
ncbi:hypothetical protein NC652_004595 [Populus alba x Populus x berolinensis]|nr:hypothetical protein NC652_004595 [Populus alba x Populus x berolinensis]